MDADAENQASVGSVSDLEAVGGVQKVQRHRGHLSCVVVPVPYGQPTHHHVCVSYRLNLMWKIGMAWISVVGLVKLD